VLGIGWPTVSTNAPAEATALHLPLVCIVAICTQRLQRSELKLLPITMMWFEMIADRCWRYDPTVASRGDR
jgi:hypothetical protein